MKKVSKQTPIEDYLFYLERFSNFDEIPVYCKDSAYEVYVKNLSEYILNFYIKTHPLEKTNDSFQEITSEFEEAFTSADSEKLNGWRSELKKVRAEEIKVETYCIPCKQSFMNENSFIHHKLGKKHISIVNRLKGGPPNIDMLDKSLFKNEKEEA